MALALKEQRSSVNISLESPWDQENTPDIFTPARDVVFVSGSLNCCSKMSTELLHTSKKKHTKKDKRYPQREELKCKWNTRWRKCVNWHCMQICSARSRKRGQQTKGGRDKPSSLGASLWGLSIQRDSPERDQNKSKRQSQDRQRTKNPTQDERANTMRERWHKLRGEWGLSRREAKHMQWHRYRHPQASPWRHANTAKELGHLTLAGFSSPLSFAQNGVGLSL